MKLYTLENIKDCHDFKYSKPGKDPEWDVYDIIFASDPNVKYCKAFTNEEEAMKALETKTSYVKRGNGYHDYDEWNIWCVLEDEYDDETPKGLLNRELSWREYLELSDWFWMGTTPTVSKIVEEYE